MGIMPLGRCCFLRDVIPCSPLPLCEKHTVKKELKRLLFGRHLLSNGASPVLCQDKSVHLEKYSFQKYFRISGYTQRGQSEMMPGLGDV